VTVAVDGRLVATIRAEAPLYDPEAPAEATFRGFEWAVPTYLKDGRPHVARLRAEGAAADLIGSPVTFELGPEPHDGSFRLQDLSPAVQEAGKRAGSADQIDAKTTLIADVTGLGEIRSRYPLRHRPGRAGGPSGHQRYRPWLPHLVPLPRRVRRCGARARVR
jgi:hypothetical protein